uniref:Uncharacterized protein n=1 Tax=Arundo donax TaxID=35708 RepID=A0A0A9I0B2_ARUDO
MMLLSIIFAFKINLSMLVY